MLVHFIVIAVLHTSSGSITTKILIRMNYRLSWSQLVGCFCWIVTFFKMLRAHCNSVIWQTCGGWLCWIFICRTDTCVQGGLVQI